jgi:hypothetical protein
MAMNSMKLNIDSVQWLKNALLMAAGTATFAVLAAGVFCGEPEDGRQVGAGAP